MTSQQAPQIFQRHRIANYLVDGKLCNTFAIGALGTAEDFFLLGVEQPGETHEPMITANLLGADGKVLCRLVRNMITANPGQCRKVFDEQIGYEIHDRDGNTIFAVRTRRDANAGADDPAFVMVLSGRFHDRQGKQVAQLSLAGADEFIDETLPAAFGFDGNFGLSRQLSEDAAVVARLMMMTRGATHQVIRGSITQQAFTLDGAIVHNAQFNGCKLRLTSGEFAVFGESNAFNDCHFDFYGPAGNVRNLMMELMKASARAVPTA
ncbi:hypothetical protein [Solimonas marina]|uniref:Uncharacterized protein n=1 Tax=Solimonas marina TaxID=2714601 RepID=A0A970B8T5_9GAMM|nr:hypothetical protein [Solimonas marina]NKF22614.1 hypothetical protein [Solimonas marina]